jgi:hypothetical protein
MDAGDTARAHVAAHSSGSPSAQIIRADCMVSALRSSDTPTYWPSPLRSRSYSAEDTPAATSAAA